MVAHSRRNVPEFRRIFGGELVEAHLQAVQGTLLSEEPNTHLLSDVTATDSFEQYQPTH